MRKLAAGLLTFRIAYGAALLVAPGKVAGNRWLGPGARQPAATVALPGPGAPEGAVHGTPLGALPRTAPVRPSPAASIAGDLADIAAAFASRDGIPSGSPIAPAAV